MTAGRRHLQRAPRLGLAAHLGQIRVRHPAGQGTGGLQCQGLAIIEMIRHLQQVRGGTDARALHQGRLRAVAAGQHQFAAGIPALQGHGDHAARRAQFPGQGQFPDEFILMERLGRQLSRGRQDPQGDRQVEMTTFLG